MVGFFYAIFTSGGRGFMPVAAQPSQTRRSTPAPSETEAMDIVYVAAIVAFFAATVGLVRFCAALLRQGDAK